MNDKLLLQKRVNINNQNINFLNFLHPHFTFINDLSSYDNPNTFGIIYTGEYSDLIIDKLNTITNKWIIVNSHHFDYDLTTNEGLIKYLLPLNYIKIKNSKTDLLSVYNKMNYNVLLEKIKLCLINNTLLSDDDIDSESSVYSLFTAILASQDILNFVYFNTVNKQNINLITSSVLTFLARVQSNTIKKDDSIQYTRLIAQSNKRYGKHIKSAVSKFIKSKFNKEISLYHLLTDLNRSR
jgi:hypothetical protein